MRPLLKRAVLDTLRNVGYNVVPNWRLEKFPQSNFLRKLFSLLEIDCVFDVGANNGQYGRFLRQEVEYDGLIVSFEPVPSCLESLLEAARADEKWLVEPYALGRQAGRAKFNVMAGTQFSSFLSPDHSHVDMFSVKNRVVEEIDVEVKTLDQVFPRISALTRGSAFYLKLDTQGFDLEVAMGASSELEGFRALQTEASITPIYKGMPTFIESIDAFRRMGFEVSGIFPNNPSHFPRLLEFDCHMINRSFLPRPAQRE